MVLIRQILADRVINPSFAPDRTKHGPGVYVTKPGVPAKDVGAANSETYIDINIPKDVFDRDFDDHNPEYVHRPGGLPKPLPIDMGFGNQPGPRKK